MSSIKETNFFIAEKNYSRGRPWYESLFPDPASVRGESSPSYSAHPVEPHVPELALPRRRAVVDPPVHA